MISMSSEKDSVFLFRPNWLNSKSDIWTLTDFIIISILIQIYKSFFALLATVTYKRSSREFATLTLPLINATGSEQLCGHTLQTCGSWGAVSSCLFQSLPLKILFIFFTFNSV